MMRAFDFLFQISVSLEHEQNRQLLRRVPSSLVHEEPLSQEPVSEAMYAGAVFMLVILACGGYCLNRFGNYNQWSEHLRFFCERPNPEGAARLQPPAL